jgi:hypothetical protein
MFREHFKNRIAAAMSLTVSLPAGISADAIEFVIAFLLPQILPKLGDDAAARRLALRLLASYNPANDRELQLAAEAIGFGIHTMTALTEAADPNQAAEKQDEALRRAGRLGRSAMQVRRFLGALQRERHAPRSTARLAPPHEEPAGAPLSPPAATAPAEPDAPAPQPEVPASTAPAAAAQPAPADAVVEATAKLNTAQTLLNRMKAAWKGAPPPHSKAAQEIRQQQRMVDAARMALVQVRRREAQTATV